MRDIFGMVPASFPVAKAKITHGTGHCHAMAQGITMREKRLPLLDNATCGVL